MLCVCSQLLGSEELMRDALRVIRCVRSAGAIELAGIAKKNAIARAIGANDSFAIVEADKNV